MENQKILQYEHKGNDLVLVKNQKSSKFGQNDYNGLWTITKVGRNRTVKINKGAISDVYNVCHITPSTNRGQ